MDSIPDYYTSIKAGNTIPNVPYDIIEELYIPEQETFFEDIIDIEEYRVGGKIDNKTDLFNLLLWEAYSYTGNEKELETENSTEAQRWLFGKKWYPSGIVAVHDDIVGTVVPVSGAQILMRQWFTVRNAITWANGAFTTGFVRGYARYIIQWERYHYSIRNGAFFQAETRGPEVRNQPWLVPIFGGDNKYHAHIHQAAHDYYYGHRYGLTSPPTNSGTKRQMKIAAREVCSGNSGSFSHARNEFTMGIVAQIHIRQWCGISDQVYGTTIHELAHASHSVLDKTSYDNLVRDGYWSPYLSDATVNSNKRTLETWARTVETFLTLDRYRSRLNLPNYNYTYVNYQTQSLSAIHYTSGGIDMIDNLNQRTFYNDPTYPVDNVNGYIINQLEVGLVGSRSWLQWRDNIKSRFNNPTENNLDELFNNWQ